MPVMIGEAPQAGSPSNTPVAAAHAPVKVMHIVFSLSLGGLEGGVLKLSNGFDRRRIEPSICSCREADATRQHLAPDVKLFELDRKQFGNDLVFVAKLAGLLRRERPSILHTHGWATLIEGIVAARIAGVPLVVHGEHGTLQSRKVAVQRFAWGKAAQVLSVSTKLAERMSAMTGFPLERIRTIRNGVDADRFNPLLRAEARGRFGFSDTDLVIGTVGRLEAVKDQHRFLDAAAEIARRRHPVKFVVAGDGTLRQELETHAGKLGIAGLVSFLGMRLDVECVMAALDIFVLSSKSEGLSNTILEAMASGLPVVATDVGGARELLEPGVHGLLVPPLNAVALADAIEALTIDEARRLAMGAASRRRATTEFSLPAMVRKYEDLYVELFRNKS